MVTFYRKILGARTIPGERVRMPGALLATQLRMGSSRAAEPEARAAERVGRRVTERGQATSRNIDRRLVRLRWSPEPMAHRKGSAEPMARRELTERGTGQALTSSLQARSPPSRGGGERTTFRPSEKMGDWLEANRYHLPQKGSRSHFGRIATK